MSIKDFDDIDVSKKVDDAIERGILKFENEKKRKSIKNKTRMYGTTAAIAGVVTIGMSSPAIAERIPFVGDVFKSISSVTGENQSKFATAVNQTVTSNGVSVTMSQILCDGQALYISYIVEGQKPLVDEGGLWQKQLLLNSADSLHLSFTDKEPGQFSSSGIVGEFKDANTFIGMVKYDLTQLDVTIPNEFTVEQNFTTIQPDMDNDSRFKIIKGHWNFKVPVTVNKDLGRVIGTDIEQNGYKISKIYLNPYDMVIEKNMNGEEKLKSEMDIESIQAFNDDGSKIKYNSESAHMVRFDAPKEGSKYIRVLVRKPKPVIDKGNGTYETTGFYKEPILDVKIPIDTSIKE